MQPCCRCHVTMIIYWMSVQETIREMRRITLTRLDLLVSRVRKYCSNPLIPANNIQDYHNVANPRQTDLDLVKK